MVKKLKEFSRNPDYRILFWLSVAALIALAVYDSLGVFASEGAF